MRKRLFSEVRARVCVCVCVCVCVFYAGHERDLVSV